MTLFQRFLETLLQVITPATQCSICQSKRGRQGEIYQMFDGAGFESVPIYNFAL